MNTKPMRRKDDGIVRKSNHKVVGLLIAVIITFCLVTLSRSDTFTASSDVEISTTTEATATTTTYETTTSTTTTKATSTTTVDTTNESTSVIPSTTATTNMVTAADKQHTPIQTKSFAVPSKVIETTSAAEMTTEPITDVEQPTTEPKPIVIVYKPSTHYIHKSNCRWADSTCYEITDTNGIEARKCSECAPDIEIVNAYVPPAPQGSLAYITDDERIMLCNVVAGEYGSDWVSLYDKACVVAVVMNRYNDGGWQGAGRANTISNVLTAPGQFVGYYAANGYNSLVTQSCIDAVEYYFNHQGDFPHYLSFYGDGRANYFS